MVVCYSRFEIFSWPLNNAKMVVCYSRFEIFSWPLNNAKVVVCYSRFEIFEHFSDTIAKKAIASRLEHFFVLYKVEKLNEEMTIYNEM